MSAEKLFQRVIEAHGGDERWRRVRALQVDVRCGGAALMARFQGNAYRRNRAVVDIRTPRVRFTPFKGCHGMFTPERVWIETDQGAVRQERINPRQFFPSWRRVYPRRGDNRALPFPTLIWIDIDHIDVIDE